MCSRRAELRGRCRLISNRHVEAVLEALWQDETPRSRDIWVILDSARNPAIYNAVHYTNSDKSCLYSGDLPRPLALAAPYLVQVYKDDRFTEEIISQGWGDSWGVYFRCSSSIERVRRHLRRFLVVRDSRGRRLVFRYYDPRVLRAYLPTCTASELETVFGPIDEFMLEGESPDTLLRFKFAKGKLAVQEVRLWPVARSGDSARAPATGETAKA